jgi:hypothetical protein
VITNPAGLDNDITPDTSAGISTTGTTIPAALNDGSQKYDPALIFQQNGIIVA